MVEFGTINFTASEFTSPNKANFVISWNIICSTFNFDVNFIVKMSRSKSIIISNFQTSIKIIIFS